MSEMIETEVPPRNSKLIKWLLILSLAVNLMLVGVIGGAIWVRHNINPLERMTASFLKTLPDEKRNSIADIFKQHKNTIEPQWKEVISTQLKVINLLKQDNFDPKQLDKMLEELLQLQNKLQTTRHQLVVELSKNLTTEERRTFIRVWNRYMRRFKRFFPRATKTKS